MVTLHSFTLKLHTHTHTQKTARKYKEDPDRYTSLQVMLDYEREIDSAGVGSATEGLLWLKRSVYICIMTV